MWNNKEIVQSINYLKSFTGISVVGGGASGRAAVKLLLALNLPVTLHEKNFTALPKDFQDFVLTNEINFIDGEHQPEHFNSCDLLIPSPGVAISSLQKYLPTNKDILVMAETEFASIFCKGIKMLAITGTSGKTTTTSLCAKMLETQGFSVFLGGNIGVPLSNYVLSQLAPQFLPTEEICPKAEVLVLELSSFQLQNCRTLHPNVAICLNLSENHLDYHADMTEYIDAKMQIFANQNADDYAILGKNLQDLPKKYNIKSQVIYFDDKARNFVQTKLIGQHNQSNAEAAWQACQKLGVSFENAKLAVQSFTPMPHRLEFVTEIDGVTYYNDSKCTTVDALKVAIKAASESGRPIALLAGGKFKGGDLAALVEIMQNKVKHIALYGANRHVFEEAFQEFFPISYDQSMQEAILRLQDIVKANDLVLLAPATSSFDQYQNYEERGKDFINTVLALNNNG